MKQRFKILTLIAVMLLSIFSVPLSAAARNITLKLNGKAIQSDVSPVIMNDRTLIPVRALFEELGASVSWDSANRKATVSYNGTKVELTINSKTAYVNGEAKQLDTAAMILQSRTMIPVRFVAENLGFAVGWDAASYTVSVNTKSGGSGTTTPSYSYSYKLTAANAASYTDKTVITVKGVGKAKSSVMTLSNPTRIVYDFKDTKLSAASDKLTLNDSLLTSVRLGQFDSTTSRVVLDVSATEKYTYSAKADGDDFVITIALSGASGGSDNAGSNTSTETNTDKKLDPTGKRRIVFIDPGHGGSEVGTVGKIMQSTGHTDLLGKIEETEKTIYEKDLNLAISLKVDKLLKAAGIETCMLRTTDTYINIYDRPKIANEKDAFLFLCIHNNASTSTSVNGTQVYYSDSCPAYTSLSNKELATIYYEAITKATGLKKSGVIDNNRYIVINQTKMPALILEIAFVSNQSDLQKLLDSSFTDKVAQGIRDATVEALSKIK